MKYIKLLLKILAIELMCALFYIFGRYSVGESEKLIQLEKEVKELRPYKTAVQTYYDAKNDSNVHKHCLQDFY